MLSTDFSKTLSIKFQENRSSGRKVLSCGQANGMTDTTTLIVAFPNFSNTPKED
jgi:hypothetical protein